MRTARNKKALKQLEAYIQHWMNDGWKKKKKLREWFGCSNNELLRTAVSKIKNVLMFANLRNGDDTIKSKNYFSTVLSLTNIFTKTY